LRCKNCVWGLDGVRGSAVLVFVTSVQRESIYYFSNLVLNNLCDIGFISDVSSEFVLFEKVDRNLKRSGYYDLKFKLQKNKYF